MPHATFFAAITLSMSMPPIFFAAVTLMLVMPPPFRADDFRRAFALFHAPRY